MSINIASSLQQQQSKCRYVEPIAHLIMIHIQQTFALTPFCCIYSTKAANAKLTVFQLTRPRSEATIYGS